MKIKGIKQKRLMRPSDAFFPVALLAGCLTGFRRSAAELYAFFLAAKLLGLGVSSGVRIAFAGQPSLRAARGSVKAALLIQMTGTLAGIGFCLARFRSGSLPRALPLLAAGCLLNIEHIFYEYLFSVGDGRSAAMCRILTSAFVTAGLLMRAPPESCGCSPVWLCAAAALSALICATVALLIGGGLKGRINARVLRCTPRAMIQAALYPAAALAVRCFLPSESITCGFFAGLTVLELCRTPFRRIDAESRNMNRALRVVCAAGASLIVAGIPAAFSGAPQLPRRIPGCMPQGTMLLLSCLCAFLLFGSLRRNGAQ